MRKGNLIKLLLQKHKKAFGKCLILKQKGELINDPERGLFNELEFLNLEDLKERLIVAEKVMKSLFIRN